MQELPEVLKGLAALAWPAIVLAMIWLFRPAVASIMESAKTREFSVEIGGQKLSMKEANDQQRALIADLQSKVSELAQRLDSVPTAQGDADAPQAPVRSPAPQAEMEEVISVLWVDDSPKNNSYFIDEFQKLGIRVELALSTADGLQKLKQKKYSIILSDMGRYEDGAENADAGLDLLRAVRATDQHVPFFIFCSRRAAERFGDEAVRAGATGISSSPTDLYTLLNFNALKERAR